METITVTLAQGLTVNGQRHIEAAIRQATVQDMLDAQELSGDPEVVGAEILMRQVVSIGDIKGPLDRALFGKLTLVDMEKLAQASEELDNRGRGSAGA